VFQVSAADDNDSKWASMLRGFIPIAQDYCGLFNTLDTNHSLDEATNEEWHTRKETDGQNDRESAEPMEDRKFWNSVVRRGEMTFERVQRTLNILIEKAGFSASDDSIDRDQPVERFQNLARSANILDVLMAMIMAPVTCPCGLLQDVELWAADKLQGRPAADDHGPSPISEEVADILKPIHDLLFVSLTCLIKDNREAEIYVAEHYGAARKQITKDTENDGAGQIFSWTSTKNGRDYGTEGFLLQGDRAIVQKPGCTMFGSTVVVIDPDWHSGVVKVETDRSEIKSYRREHLRLLHEPSRQQAETEPEAQALAVALKTSDRKLAWPWRSFAWPIDEAECDVLTWIALIIKQAVRFIPTFFHILVVYLNIVWTYSLTSRKRETLLIFSCRTTRNSLICSSIKKSLIHSSQTSLVRRPLPVWLVGRAF
jgi:hypothetical protein